MKKALYLAAAAAASLVAGSAQAAVVTGSFSLVSFSGTYVGGSQTAATATGLDIGSNGYGVNGSALVGNGTGSFATFNGASVSVSDIALTGTVGNPNVNPFVTFGSGPGAIFVNFSNALVTRSASGTNVTVAGNASFVNGADTTAGMFSLSADSSGGNPGAFNFTFTSNASAVPEPATWGLMIMGFGMMGAALRSRKTKVAFA